MIKRYFYIFSATLFILLGPTTGIKAEPLEKRLSEIERHQMPPPGFNYQAALPDDNGDMLANTDVTLYFTIQTAADGGTVQWVETHAAATSAQGLVSVVIGDGTRTDGAQTVFEAIPFGDSDMFLKVEVDQGSGFVVMDTEQLQSVPYAMVANNGLTIAQATKLDGLAADAEANIQADWNQTNENSDSYVKNKPSLSSGGGVQSDWAVTDMGSEAYIANKPDLSNFDQDVADDFDGAFGSLTGTPTDLTDLSGHGAAELNDISNVGCGAIIAGSEECKTSDGKRCVGGSSTERRRTIRTAGKQNRAANETNGIREGGRRQELRGMLKAVGHLYDQRWRQSLGLGAGFS